VNLAARPAKRTDLGNSGFKGFTIVELLVTIVIVGILASAVLPMVELSRQRAQEQDLRSALKELRTAIDAYKQAVDEGHIIRKADESGYPHALEELVDGWWTPRIRVAHDNAFCAGFHRILSWSPAPCLLKIGVSGATFPATRIRGKGQTFTMSIPCTRCGPQRNSLSGVVMTIRPRGFTLIELLVVLAIIATLLTIAVPRYTGSVDKAKESVLKENLATLREAIDKHYGDTSKYPATLNDLVTNVTCVAYPLIQLLTVPPVGSCCLLPILRKGRSLM